MAGSSEPLPIKDVVSNVIARLSGDGHGEHRLSAEEIEGLWKKAAGSPASKRSRPTSLRKGKLVVTVGDSSLLYDLTLRKRRILEALRKELKDKLRDIQFRIGEASEEANSKIKSQKSKGKNT